MRHCDLVVGVLAFGSNKFLLSHLWSGSKINDSIQFKALAKLVIHPVMPVLINGPLCFIHAVRFIQIRCKNIPARESVSTQILSKNPDRVLSLIFMSLIEFYVLFGHEFRENR